MYCRYELSTNAHINIHYRTQTCLGQPSQYKVNPASTRSTQAVQEKGVYLPRYQNIHDNTSLEVQTPRTGVAIKSLVNWRPSDYSSEFCACKNPSFCQLMGPPFQPTRPTTLLTTRLTDRSVARRWNRDGTWDKFEPGGIFWRWGTYRLQAGCKHFTNGSWTNKETTKKWVNKQVPLDGYSLRLKDPKLS